MSNLPPWITDAAVSDVERQIMAALIAIIFMPIVTALKEANPGWREHTRLNAGPDVLEKALRNGRLMYHPETGEFIGTLNVSLTKALEQLGARWHKGKKVYVLTNAPAWVTAASTAYAMNARAAHKEIERRLTEAQRNLESLVKAKRIDPSAVAQNVRGGYKSFADAIGIDAPLSPASEAKVRREYTDNVEIQIQSVAESELGRLRKEVSANAASGARYDDLVERIESRYRVSKAKATQIAYQETSNFLAKHRRARFGEAGVVEYFWSTAGDGRVRDDHKDLNGKRFRYDDSPIVNKHTGKRANPGEDFGCRCADKPILPALAKEAA